MDFYILFCSNSFLLFFPRNTIFWYISNKPTIFLCVSRACGILPRPPLHPTLVSVSENYIVHVVTFVFIQQRVWPIAIFVKCNCALYRQRKRQIHTITNILINYEFVLSKTRKMNKIFLINKLHTLILKILLNANPRLNFSSFQWNKNITNIKVPHKQQNKLSYIKKKKA